MCKFNNGGSTETGSPHRLPRTVIPASYDLKLEPDLAGATFTGEVTIDVEVCQPVSEIVLNAADLEIQEATVANDKGTLLNGTVSLDKENERATIAVNGTIGSGSWQLKLRFTGELNDKLKGFYRSTYTDEAGAEQIIATTQFESTDARRAFPCFDEPDFKAVFKITLTVDKNLQAVSNASIVKETPLSNGKKVVEFAPTMKMSTYIVAFVVGKLTATRPISVDGIDVRLWCVPGREHLSKFALESAQFALRYFKRYFGVSYPGDKLDLLAIPDFAAGAMENLGCVTFRETVLVDPATAAQGDLDWVAEVVSHELAHMWFGDLVTMKWWNGLWLNEAFATFMAAKAVDAFKKDWKVWDKFGLSRGTAMRTDGLKSTRPVEFTVNHPDEAAGMFDVLTYEKGCSVMRMLEQFLGEETFRRGIALYIQQHSYGNTQTNDLWQALESESGQPVRNIMDGWIFKSGYPVVSIKESDMGGSVVLSQQSFKFLSEAVDPQQLWSVPVMLRAKTADGIQEMKLLLTQAEQTIYIGEGLEWVVVNAGGHGFFRVRYSSSLASKLTASVQENLSVIERVNLLGDSWACVRAGLESTGQFLNLVKLFSAESDPNVWSTILGPLATIREHLPVTHRPGLEKMVRELIQPTLDRLGWESREGETSQTRELRADIIGALGRTGNDASVQAKARELFESWKKDPRSIDGNIVSTVVGLVAASGDDKLFDEFFQSFKGAATPQDQERFLYAMAKFPTVELLTKTLEHALDPAKIRTQDAPYVVARVMQNEVASKAAWEFVKNNWAKMVEIYPESGLVRLCGGVTALNTPELEAEVKDFFAANPVKGGDKAISQYLEMLRIAVLFRERESAPLTASFTPPAPPVETEDAGADGKSGTDAGTVEDTAGNDKAEVTVDAPTGDGAVRPPVPADAGVGKA